MASNNEPEWRYPVAVLDTESVSMDGHDKEVETAIRQRGRSDDLESMRVGVGIELGLMFGSVIAQFSLKVREK